MNQDPTADKNLPDRLLSSEILFDSTENELGHSKDQAQPLDKSYLEMKEIALQMESAV